MGFLDCAVPENNHANIFKTRHEVLCSLMVVLRNHRPRKHCYLVSVASVQFPVFRFLLLVLLSD